jgi:hypothetical protein
MKIASILHSFPAGDLISILPGLRQVSKDNDCKWIIYQRINQPYDMGMAYTNAKHSIYNEYGEPVMMNLGVFSALRPLLLAQDYIADFIEWDGQSVDFNFDLIREQPTTLPAGCINRWPMYIWPDMATDLSQKWLEVPNARPILSEKKIILINRTERYNNTLISYNFLKKYEQSVLFIGMPNEHAVFCRQNKLEIPRFMGDDFYKIAVAMTQCKLFIGNQSSCFQVAEGLKIPRILEVCNQIPNVIGGGYGFHDFLTQKSLEYYVDKLYHEGMCTYSGVIKQLDQQSKLYNS